MTLQEFKNMAGRLGIVYDNKEKACQEWSRTWGFSWWRDLWMYKEYTYQGYTYRTGQVVHRHGHYPHTEFACGDKLVARKEFMRAIREMEFRPEFPAPPKIIQLSLSF